MKYHKVCPTGDRLSRHSFYRVTGFQKENCPHVGSMGIDLIGSPK